MQAPMTSGKDHALKYTCFFLKKGHSMVKGIGNVCDKTLGACLEKHGITSMHISISHERDVCVAVVVLEGETAPKRY